MTKEAFCAKCQKRTIQTLSQAKGEIIFTCPCNRIIKFHGKLSTDEISNLLRIHEEHNKGQFSAVKADIEEGLLNAKLVQLSDK